MKISNIYKPRSIRFIEVYHHHDWSVKLYSIKSDGIEADQNNVNRVKNKLAEWLQCANKQPFNHHHMAMLIIHECAMGCFAIVNWWVEENMLQQYVYLSTTERPEEFKWFSENGVYTCVWEMLILCFERNNWVENVLKNAPNPNFEIYLKNSLNGDF